MILLYDNQEEEVVLVKFLILFLTYQNHFN